MQERILRLPAVEEITGLPRSTIYLKISKNLFPPQIYIGKRSVGWLKSDVDEWINKQIQQTKTAKP